MTSDEIEYFAIKMFQIQHILNIFCSNWQLNEIWFTANGLNIKVRLLCFAKYFAISGMIK